MRYRRQIRPRRSSFVASVVCTLAFCFVAVFRVVGGGKEPGRDQHLAADQQLRQAVLEGNLPQLKVAISEQANVNARNPTNDLPPLLELLRAATGPLDTGHRECAACLVAHGADVDLTDSDQRTAVIYATRLGDLDTLRLLVEAQAFVRTRDRFHKTALFYAAEAHRRDLVAYLTQNGALISLSVKERRAGGKP
jgi:ankyrin repeat protein